MINRLLHRSTRAWLIALMATILLGVQLLQYSPLHDHAREVADCALCHLQPLGDDTEIDHSLPTPILTAFAVVIFELIETPRAAAHTPYQGRAPPLFSH